VLKQINQQNWVQCSALPDQKVVIAIACDPQTDPPTLFAATANHVFVSRDEGATWQGANLGLPKSVVCQDIRLTINPVRSFLSLSTWGRSLWIADLPRWIWRDFLLACGVTTYIGPLDRQSGPLATERPRKSRVSEWIGRGNPRWHDEAAPRAFAQRQQHFRKGLFQNPA
jgi:hypothetical protein